MAVRRRTGTVPVGPRLVVGLLALGLTAAGSAAAAGTGGGSSAVLVRDTEAGVDPLPSEVDPLFGPQPADVAAEPSVAADPADPRHAVVVFKVGIGQGIGYAATSTAGRTWSASGTLPLTARGGVGSAHYLATTDPVVAFGPDGTAYVTFIAATQAAEGLGFDVKLVSSHDGGLSWSAPTTVFSGAGQQNVAGAGTNPDKEWLAVDTGTGPGHHPGRVYVVWSQEPAVPLATYSDDPDRAGWALPAPVQVGHGTDVQPLVLSDGSLGVFYDTGDYGVQDVGEEYRFVRAAAPSPGEPLTFGSPVTVAPAVHLNEPDLAGKLDPASAVTDGEGKLYAAWASSAAGRGLNDIVVTWSLDDGETWSPPAVVSGAHGDNVHPALAVTRTAVRLTWRERVVRAGRLTSTVVSNGRDLSGWGPAGPSSLSPQYPAGSVATDLVRAENVAGDPPAYFLGDYDQAASAGPFTYFARAEAYAIDDTGPHERIWVAVLGDG